MNITFTRNPFIGQCRWLREASGSARSVCTPHCRAPGNPCTACDTTNGWSGATRNGCQRSMYSDFI